MQCRKAASPTNSHLLAALKKPGGKTGAAQKAYLQEKRKKSSMPSCFEEVLTGAEIPGGWGERETGVEEVGR